MNALATVGMSSAGAMRPSSFIFWNSVWKLSRM